MKYHLTRTVFTGQQKLIETRGDELWELLCDELREQRFTLGDAARVFMKKFGYKYSTATHYAAAIIRNVQAESGEDVLRQSGRQWFWV